MVLGGVGVGLEADLLNLILRRQPAAAEAVDEELRARPGHLHQLLGHLVGIVREAGNVVGRQRRREAVVAARCGALFLDEHLFANRDGERRDCRVVAALDGERHGHALETVRLDAHLVVAGHQVAEGCDPAFVHQHLSLEAGLIDQGDDRGDERGLGFVAHGDAQVRRALRRGDEGEEQDEAHPRENDTERTRSRSHDVRT